MDGLFRAGADDVASYCRDAAVIGRLGPAIDGATGSAMHPTKMVRAPTAGCDRFDAAAAAYIRAHPQVLELRSGRASIVPPTCVLGFQLGLQSSDSSWQAPRKRRQQRVADVGRKELPLRLAALFYAQSALSTFSFVAQLECHRPASAVWMSGFSSRSGASPTGRCLGRCCFICWWLGVRASGPQSLRFARDWLPLRTRGRPEGSGRTSTGGCATRHATAGWGDLAVVAATAATWPAASTTRAQGVAAPRGPNLATQGVGRARLWRRFGRSARQAH